MVLNYSAAVTALRNDGVIAYPTEAVYGLGCAPFSEKAVKKLLALKQRGMAKGLILIAADFTQLQPLLRPLPQERFDQILATWPGPVSWAWPKTDKIPAYIHGDWDSVVVRVSAHPIVQQLCLQFGGPLVSTSANRQGENPCRSAAEVKTVFGSLLDDILIGDVGGLDKPTPIFDALTGHALR
ncbi:MAG: putative ribosome maturation factor [Gammaproteobacteria bacterium]|jgi:L-threonylcarbamoyladenylate synthase|nr:putative ribosome maturation factor [Gammaproteobacteria bacterium]